MTTRPSRSFLKYWLSLLVVFTAGVLFPRQSFAVEEARTIDVLIVYTPAVRAYHGNADGVQAHVNSMIASTNQAYADSGIDGQLRLAGLQEVNYTESTVSYNEDLYALTNTNDGVLDQVHALRNEVRADMVCLLRKGGVDGVAGLAWVLQTMNGTPTHAFSVSGTEFGVRAFAHELGHNQGCAHDRDNAGATGVFSYSYGYCFTGNNGTFYGTIMAYPGTTIMRFSNPQLTYQGVPTGRPEGDPNSADNARTINATLPVIVGYRESLQTVETPVFNPNGGNYTSPVQVSLSVATAGATIRYTIDGSDVTESSPVYIVPFELPYSAVVKARGYLNNYNPSAQVSANFTITYPATAEAPEITPSGGTFADSVEVSMSTYLPDVMIHYTTNGAEVTHLSPVYNGPFELTQSATVKARGYLPGHNPSPLVSANFTVTITPRVLAPSIVPNGGSHLGSVTVNLQTFTEGATIRYTTDGTDVTETSPTYSGPFVLTQSATVKARGYRADYKSSEQSSATFTVIPLEVAMPQATPNGGGHLGSVQVALWTSTEGATIRYTTNGADVTGSSPIYNGPFTLAQTSTVKARGYRTDYDPSAQMQVNFVVHGFVEVIKNATSAIAAGEEHSLFLTDDGELRAMGWNRYGQLGNGTTINQDSPVTIAQGVVSVNAARYHTLFVTDDDVLWAMGRNYYGQLGDGSTTDRVTPVPVTSNVQLTAAGDYHSLFTTKEGALYAMGRNNYGQLGDDTNASRSTPVPVAEDVLLVAAGAFHSAFVTQGGTLWTMGRNDDGQLGNGTIVNRSTPVPVAQNVIAVTAGEFHTLYLTTDGRLWSTGRNEYGQLGDGTNVNRTSPVVVAQGVKSIAAGLSHSFFLKTDGSLWAMGRNDDGQLGDGTTQHRSVPVLVAQGVVSVTAGGSHSLYILADGTRLSMGRNTYGQLGNGTTTSSSAPTQVSTLVATSAPVISPIGGVQEGPVTVSLGGAASGATIRYTTDGTDVSTGSLVYNEPFVLENSGTVKARSYLDGYAPSSQSSARFTIIPLPSEVAPVITRQPVSQTGITGQSVAFNVAATGSPTPTYQWKFNGNDIPGATHSTYAIAKPGTTHAGTYTVEVRNSAGVVTSNTVTLELKIGPVITRQPVSLTIDTGGTATFSVVATGSPEPTYQWRRNGMNIAGATGSSYTLENVLVSPPYTYDVVVSNNAGSVASAKVTLTVPVTAGPPVVAEQPASQTVWQGENVTFSVNASSLDKATYQWAWNGRIIRGATKPSYTLQRVSTRNAGTYTVTVKNSYGETVSEAAVLSVNVPTRPRITKMPQRQETGLGKSVTFSVEATGNPPPSYQWMLNGKPIEGATESTYTVENVESADLGRYTVVVTSGPNKVSSGVATLTEIVPPQITSAPQGEVVGLANRGVVLVVRLAPNRARPNYQWLKDGEEIPGATRPNYVAKEDGAYSVRVSNGAGSVAGEIARVKLIMPPRVASFTSSATSVVAGDPVTFEVALQPGTGTEPLTYTWYFNGRPDPNAPNGPAYTATNITRNSSCFVIVSNGSGRIIGRAASRAIVIRAILPPTIIRQPVGVELQEGRSSRLFVQATGTARLTYQWYRNGVPIPNAIQPVLPLTRVTVANAGTYTVVIDNPAGRPVTSAAVTVSVPSSSAGVNNSSTLTGSSSLSLSGITSEGSIIGNGTLVVDMTVPVTLSSIGRITLDGVVMNAASTGWQQREQSLIILSATGLQDGTYTYTRTGVNTGTLAYRVNREEAGVQVESGVIQLVFTSKTGGTYTVTGSYPEDETSGEFVGQGSFILGES